MLNKRISLKSARSSHHSLAFHQLGKENVMYLKQKKWLFFLTGVFFLTLPTVAAAQDLISTISSISVVNAQVTYDIQVCNIGNGKANNTTLGLYYDLSAAPDCITSPDQTWMVSSLDAGECKTYSHSRANVIAGNYMAWAQADHDCKLAETNETNNSSSQAYSVMPELYIVSLTAGVSGTTVTYTVTIRNSGATTSQAFNLGLYYHRSSSPGCNSAADQTWFFNGLSHNETVTKQFIRDNVPPGAYQAWGMVDNGCAIQEPDENNNIYGRAYSVGPDIYIATPNITVSGSTVTYSAYICNLGSVATGSFNVSLWYNRATSPACDTTGPDHSWSVINLPAWSGDSTTSCTTLTHIRNTTLPGTYTGWFFADASCAIEEYDENNNIGSRQYTITSPDFYISSFQASVVGDQVTYSTTVCNQGETTSVPFVIGLFYNSATAPGCTTSPDFSWPEINGLATGGCVTLSHIRTGVAQGNYNAWVLADQKCTFPEPNETNNLQSSSYAIAPTQPDLTIVALTAIPNGSTVTYSALVCNGGLDITSSFTAGFYLNRTTAPNCQATPDLVVTHSSGLASGNCVSLSQTKSAVEPGSYTAWALVDQSCQISEYNENNNTASFSYTVTPPQMPDLVVQEFTVTVNGSSVTFVAKVCNQGTAKVADASTVGLFYHRSDTPSPICLNAADVSASLGALEPNACDVRTWIQANVAPGSYLAWAMADAACTIGESNESNNTLSKAYVVTSLTADLGVPDGGSSTDAKANEDSNQIDGTGGLDQGQAIDLGKKEDSLAGLSDGPTGRDDSRLPDSAKTSDSSSFADAGTQNSGDAEAQISTDGGVKKKDGTTDQGNYLMPGADGGCDCQVGGGSVTGGLGAMLAAFFILAFSRRRRS